MHALASIHHIVMDVKEPYRNALILRAAEKGIMYKIRCVNPAGLSTRWDGVDRRFGPNEEKILPAIVAAALIQTYNVDMVAASATHPGGMTDDTPAPFREPNFIEVVDEERKDLGPDLVFVTGGVSLSSELLKEVRQDYAGAARARGRSVSDEVSTDEIRDVAQPAAAAPRKVTSTGV